MIKIERLDENYHRLVEATRCKTIRMLTLSRIGTRNSGEIVFDAVYGDARKRDSTFLKLLSNTNYLSSIRTDFGVIRSSNIKMTMPENSEDEFAIRIHITGVFVG